MTDRDGLPPLHLQLAGPAARPNGHPDHAFVLEQLAIGEYPTPEDAAWLRTARRRSPPSSPCRTTSISTARGCRCAALGARLRRARHPLPSHSGRRTATATPCAPASTKRSALLAELIARGERVYLHCNAGLNRAPTVAIAYLHVHRGHASMPPAHW